MSCADEFGFFYPLQNARSLQRGHIVSELGGICQSQPWSCSAAELSTRPCQNPSKSSSLVRVRGAALAALSVLGTSSQSATSLSCRVSVQDVTLGRQQLFPRAKQGRREQAVPGHGILGPTSTRGAAKSGHGVSKAPGWRTGNLTGINPHSKKSFSHEER